MNGQLRIDADLEFSIADPATADGAGSASTGTVRAHGSRIEIRSEQVAALSTLTSTGSARSTASALARRGLTVSIGDSRGPLVTVGAVPRAGLQRLVTRSAHIRIRGLRGLVTLARGRRLRARQVASGAFLPPTTMFPVAPTLARSWRRRVTTTHDPEGGGRPRLIFSLGPYPTIGAQPRVFDLPPGVTRIGSAPTADLRLDGLDEQHAEIMRSDADEYVFIDLSRERSCRVHGASVSEQALRMGMRIELGGWTMSYYREEYADHGRPYGGRIGGELGHQRPQPPRGLGAAL
ncbi:MAG: FHA domain-containing protein [Actinomycetota bacterium]|nr:FHA domain-containing protein [Actinomycetota bacterium]